VKCLRKQVHQHLVHYNNELVFLDISRTEAGHDLVLDVISETAEKLFIPLTVGGMKSFSAVSEITSSTRSCPASVREMSKKTSSSAPVVFQPLTISLNC
jgi:imidazole glycerol phosphate synthase subunit HisF